MKTAGMPILDRADGPEHGVGSIPCAERLRKWMVIVRICEIVPPILFGLFADPAFDGIVVHINEVAPRLLVPEFRDASEWTLEKFLTLVKGAHSDSISGGIGIYGLLRETGSSNGNHMHFLVGCGVQSTETDPDGNLRQAIGDKTEKISDIFDQLRPVLTDTSLCMTYDEVNERFTEGSYSSKWYRGRGAFAAGHFLFIQNGMDVSVEISDMTDRYGVVPNPKYNSDQENYYHKVDRFSAIWGIPNTPDRIDFDRLEKVFDYWAYVSSETVMPAYYEVTIKTRRFSDPVASEMIDIVKGSLVYDAGDIYGLNILGTLDSAFVSGNVGSALNAQYLKTIDVSIKSIVSSIESKYGG